MFFDRIYIFFFSYYFFSSKNFKRGGALAPSMDAPPMMLSTSLCTRAVTPAFFSNLELPSVANNTMTMNKNLTQPALLRIQTIPLTHMAWERCVFFYPVTKLPFRISTYKLTKGTLLIKRTWLFMLLLVYTAPIQPSVYQCDWKSRYSTLYMLNVINFHHCETERERGRERKRETERDRERKTGRSH